MAHHSQQVHALESQGGSSGGSSTSLGRAPRAIGPFLTVRKVAVRLRAAASTALRLVQLGPTRAGSREQRHQGGRGQPANISASPTTVSCSRRSTTVPRRRLSKNREATAMTRGQGAAAGGAVFRFAGLRVRRRNSRGHVAEPSRQKQNFADWYRIVLHRRSWLG